MWPCFRQLARGSRGPRRFASTFSRPAGPHHQNIKLKSAAAGAFVGILTGAAVLGGWYGKDTQLLPIAPAPPRVYASVSATMQGLQEIRDQLGHDAVSMDEDDIEDHGFSEWSTSNSTARPTAIVRPSSTDQVSIVAKICSKYKIPMVPFGAGSSVEGNFASPRSGICIDVSQMDKVIDFHPEDLDVVVQAGVNWMDLNKQIDHSGLFLPLDPSPTAQIGGMIATNCSGTNAMRYGTMKDYVLNLTIVLADGSIVKTRHRPRKTSAGYNLTALFAGSEGTLGIITEATLKLAVIPESFSVATATFPTVKDAATAASAMIRKGVNLAALELMDDLQMKVVNLSGGAGGRTWAELPTLFIKFSGSQQNVRDSMLAAQQVAKSSSCEKFASATGQEEMDSLWSARKQALWASLAIRPEGTQVWSTDVAVPISRMADMIEECKAESAKLGLFSSVLGHVGDGNFHQMIMYNPDEPGEEAAVKQFVNDMVDKALIREGTVSGEHGIGLGKKHCLLKELSPTTIGVMKALKQSLDPDWLMNPGKVFDE